MASALSKPQQAKPRYQVKYLIGAFLIFGVIGYLIFFGLTQTSQWALQVGDFTARGPAAVGQGARVSGQLEANSVKKDVQDNKIAFVLTDGKNRLSVVYSGVVPDTFDRATEVVVEGKLTSDGTFTASNVLAKCPSKYDESKLEWYDTSQGGNLSY